MLVVALVSIFIKITGFYKETVVASFFGLSEILDTYLIAVLIPTFVQNVFINAVSNLFVPNYIIELKTSRNIKEFQTVSFIIVSILVCALVLICLIFSEYFLSHVFPGHSTRYYSLIKTQLYWTIPCLFLWGYSSLLTSLLEVKSRFLFSSFSPFFITLTTLICLFWFKDALGDIVLAFGMLSGSILSFIYLLGFCVYFKELSFGYPSMNANVKKMLSQLPPKLTSGFLTGTNGFIDKFFAAQLVTGSIAALNYGSKIPSFAVAMLILPLGRVLLPHFSKTVNENLEGAFRQLFFILKVVFMTTAIISFIVFVFSHEIVQILFERNQFTPKDTSVVASIQQIGLIYIPFYLSTLICVKFLTAINKNKFMAWTSFWNLGVNLVLNIILMRFYGVYGLALSTTIVYVSSCCVYVYFTLKQYRLMVKNSTPSGSNESLKN